METTNRPEERICFVHVGKAGGSSVGCQLGFSLHCDTASNATSSTSESAAAAGLLPLRTTRIFHADTYDCHDDSAYFLFVVRDPLERIKSAFLYERPWDEASLKEYAPTYYDRRKAFYLDCPFWHLEDYVQLGLGDAVMKHTDRPTNGGNGEKGGRKKGGPPPRPEYYPKSATENGQFGKVGPVSEECKMRAFAAVWGTRHYTEHFYFNYQFHFEGIPENARVLVIRNEHLVQDWNGVEEFIGGEKEIIPPDYTVPVMNKSKKKERDRYLSKDSVRIMCRELCNEILNYKKLLRRALNLNQADIAQSMEELRNSCPKEADLEECPLPMPDIREKLINTRGYKYVVMEKSYLYNREKLESGESTKAKAEKVEKRERKRLNGTSGAEGEEDDEFTDDGYQLI